MITHFVVNTLLEINEETTLGDAIKIYIECED